MPFAVRCPTCTSPSVRLTAPETPDVQTFRCNVCDRQWSTLPGLSQWTTAHVCPKCKSPALLFVEHSVTNAIFRCTDCEQVVAIPVAAL